MGPGLRDRKETLITPHVLVIGGGFAGAAAASSLAERGVSVTLLEQRATLGGRAASLRDGVTREELDNGQHLFLGAYRDTRRFLRRLRVEERLRFLPSFRVPFYSKGGRRSVLSCPALPGGLGFVAGLAAFGELSLKDRWAVLRALARFKAFKPRREWADLTVSQWLDKLRQPAGARRAFWTPLTLATLNDRPERAPAAALMLVLREGFMGPPKDAALGYATLSLSKLWPVELAAYLKRQGGVVAPKQAVTRLLVEGGRVKGAVVESGETVEADAYVCAVPLPAFLKICPRELEASARRLRAVGSSPIASVNLWFDKPLFREPFAGLLGTDAQWVFHRHALWNGVGVSPGHVTLVFSGADAYLKMSSEELIALAVRDLKKCFPGLKDEPRHGSVVWEKQATPSFGPAAWKLRPGVETPLENFFLAGDWVDCGLPPTIEAAARSGHRAADAAKRLLERLYPDESWRETVSRAGR